MSNINNNSVVVGKVNSNDRDFFKFEKNGNVHKCCICGKEIVGFGNNPDPIPSNITDICCNECNSLYVLPIRVAYMKTAKLFNGEIVFEKPNGNETKKSDLFLDRILKISHTSSNFMSGYFDLDTDIRKEIDFLTDNDWNDNIPKDPYESFTHFYKGKTSYNEIIYELMVETIILKRIENCKSGEKISFGDYHFRKK